ncbi:MAG: ATP-grasp domain-containing protein [Gammaproteobacteria bacterium]|nr:ATP-grasp domain-containing protein [Gammaproteobacteria bacterium]
MELIARMEYLAIVMIIASGPYLSSHFVSTVERNRWPVVDAGGAAECGMGGRVRFIDSGEAAERVRSRPDCRVLTSGEHALAWVDKELAGTGAERATQRFKDKVAFREAARPVFPDIVFRELSMDQLEDFSPDLSMYPFVIKPAVGFFSIGVRTVHTPFGWKAVRRQIGHDIAAARAYFPEHMLSQTRLMIESYIEGEEFAVDGYYDAEGRPVVLNALHHRYADPADVSDRLYVSSRKIVEAIAPAARELLAAINPDRVIRNFPLHAEFRQEAGGRLVPIEVNPMRFGGWCTTGDFANFAWGFNSYELFMDSARPDWASIYRGRETQQFGLVVLDNRTGIARDEIRSFDYEALLERFSKPLHLARIDYRKFPLFGVLFVETPVGHEAELEWILRSSLSEFVTRE